jgi:hypothetical protein
LRQSMQPPNRCARRCRGYGSWMQNYDSIRDVIAPFLGDRCAVDLAVANWTRRRYLPVLITTWWGILTAASACSPSYAIQSNPRIA